MIEIKQGNLLIEPAQAGALFIRLLELYGIPGYELTKLEIQKLAYFLQVAGEPLRLEYVKHKYGPYAHNLNHVLRHMEGHYIRGYGDGTAKAESAQMYVLPAGREAAQAFLATAPAAQERLEKVSSLITGFETPYGMELLATVHWVGTQETNPAHDSEQAIELVHTWSDRKRTIFKPQHIRKAWQRLLFQLIASAKDCSKLRQEQELKAAKEARIRQLLALIPKEAKLWEEVFRLIALKQSKPYDDAIAHLRNLRDLAEHQGKLEQFKLRVQEMQTDYSNRPGLLSRLQKAGLLRL